MNQEEINREANIESRKFYGEDGWDSSTWATTAFEFGYRLARKKAQEEIEILKFERVPVEIFNETEDKMKEYKAKHHEFADACNSWKKRYDNEIEKRDRLLDEAKILLTANTHKLSQEEWLKQYEEMRLK